MVAILLILTTLMSAAAFGLTFKCIAEDNLDNVAGVFILATSGIALLASFICVIKLDDTNVDDYRPLLKAIDHDKTKIISENGEAKEYYITVNGEVYHFKFKEENENE